MHGCIHARVHKRLCEGKYAHVRTCTHTHTFLELWHRHVSCNNLLFTRNFKPVNCSPPTESRHWLRLCFFFCTKKCARHMLAAPMMTKFHQTLNRCRRHSHPVLLYSCSARPTEPCFNLRKIKSVLVVHSRTEVAVLWNFCGGRLRCSPAERSDVTAFMTCYKFSCIATHSRSWCVTKSLHSAETSIILTRRGGCNLKPT